MSINTVIENEHIRAEISPTGAELQSVKKDGKEYIWQGDPQIWQGHAPILFPICGGLKDDSFVHKGKKYFLEKHGFANKSDFELEELTKESAVFLLRDSEETLKHYPFHFEMRIRYTLLACGIKSEYRVTNTGDETMYFSLGAHEGYLCPGGIEGYSVKFEHKENLAASYLDGSLLRRDTYTVMENSDVLPLKNEYFAEDALVFLNLKSRRASLTSNETKRRIDVNFNDFDYLLLWTKSGAEYLCIEPWCGIPDFVDTNSNIAEKAGVIPLAPGKTEVKTHEIVFG